jgi:hypothetical protein
MNQLTPIQTSTFSLSKLADHMVKQEVDQLLDNYCPAENTTK